MHCDPGLYPPDGPDRTVEIMATRPGVTAALFVLTVAWGCGSDGSLPATTPTSTSASTTSAPTTTVTPSTSTTTAATTTTNATTTTMAPEPECELAPVGTVIDSAVAAARLAAGSGWVPESGASTLGAPAVTGPELAANLGLDCGARLVEDGPAGERFTIAAWTGDRVAFVLLAPDRSDPPLGREALVTILTEDLEGEYLDDDRSVFAAPTATGPTIVLGHVDYSLGATAKSWQAAITAPPDGDVTLESERHAVTVLQNAGARNVGIAQPPDSGSEEGYVQFVSPTGQINVVDVAPVEAIDPMSPRYVGGSTRVETILGVGVRITEHGVDAPSWARGAELGWTCGEYGWILEPPTNGTTDEMVGLTAEILAVDDC